MNKNLTVLFITTLDYQKHIPRCYHHQNTVFHTALRLRPIKLVGNHDTETFRELRPTVTLRHTLTDDIW